MTESPPLWEAALAAYLARAGLRVTRQRRAIAEAFFAHHGHPNIDELYSSIRAQHPHIGQATVYRTLKLLVDSGLAEPSRFGDGTTRYEAAHEGDHHDHLICTECGHIVEFRNDEIERLQIEIAERHRFAVTDHKMVIYGSCLDARCPRRVSGGERARGARTPTAGAQGREPGAAQQIRGTHSPAGPPAREPGGAPQARGVKS